MGAAILIACNPSVLWACTKILCQKTGSEGLKSVKNLVMQLVNQYILMNLIGTILSGELLREAQMCCINC